MLEETRGQGLRLNRRAGSEKDVDALSVLFTRMDYKVTVFVDLEHKVKEGWGGRLYVYWFRT
jgi:hypothetical protein